MKKLYSLFLIILTTGIIYNTNAQTCTPDDSGYTSVPNSGIMIPNPLPDAQVGVYYEQPITIGVPKSASGFTINWVKFVSLTNLIAANTWTAVNNTGGTTFPKWNRLTWQCATIKGTPTTAGTDSIRIYVNANVSILGIPYTKNNVKGYTVPIVIKAKTGIEEVSKENNVNVFPNPTKDNITIESPPALPRGKQAAVIEISNIQGQLIKTLVTNSNKTNIDVSSFPNGVYVIEVRTEKGISVEKFIKE
jgi:Secretion system C-terminal sorting domain